MGFNTKKLLVLVILDGWGMAPPSEGNAISLAETPNINRYFNVYPSTQLQASGRFVGLSEGEPGSSEVGHLTIGAGNTIFQDVSRIDLSVSDGTFFKNPAFVRACNAVKEKQGNLHLLGLFGTGKIHANKEHLYALMQLCKIQGLAKNQVKIHLFTDGRDSSPVAGEVLIKELERKIEEIGVGEIASIVGRYWAMDRDRRWERTEKAYRLLTEGLGEKAASAEEVFKTNYAKQVTDEFIPPTLLRTDSKTENIIGENDGLVFYNFRTDRMRQLTKAFLVEDFYFFDRKVKLERIFTVTMTEFEKDLPVSEVAFKPHAVDFALPRILSSLGKKQLHIAETEKYAFVTYYFNGLYEQEVVGEKRISIPSLKVATYDLRPEMSAVPITEAFKKEMATTEYNFVVINYANPDMVGHTGKIPAAIKACEVVDQCVRQVVDTTLSKGGACIITADHGNVEEMIYPETGEISTSHSVNPVPFIMIDTIEKNLPRKLVSGTLANIAPTILKIMGQQIPSNMKNKALF